MPPRVSVLLPVRDAVTTLPAALTSLLGQTLTDFEVIAIDDGSSDGSGAVLEAFAQRDERLHVITTPGRGIVGALNLALEHATAPLIARMDADDESLPTRLEASVRALEANPALAGVGTQVELFRDDRPISPNLQAYGTWLNSLTTPALLFRERFIESPLCHPSVMLRAEPLRAAGAWSDGPFPEDWELWLRLLHRGEQLSCVPEVLHRWRDHDRRLTRTDERYAFERHAALKAEYLSRAHAHRRFALWGAGEVGRALSKALQAIGSTVTRFIELNPRKLGQVIHGARVISPQQLGAPQADEHLLAAVGAKGARADIRAALHDAAWQEGPHFTCVA